VQTAPPQRERTLERAVGLTKAAASTFANAPHAKTARLVAFQVAIFVLMYTARIQLSKNPRAAKAERNGGCEEAEVARRPPEICWGEKG
jgi:hypothetical protein